MKTMMWGAYALIAAALVPAAAQAQTPRLGAEANAAYVDDQWGGELGLGLRLRLGNFDITPAAGAFLYQGDSNGYFQTTDSDGTTHCRAPNGQFADSENCNRLDARFYARAEAGFTFSAVRLGVGGRFMDDEVKPYGTIGIALTPSLSIKGLAGDDYFAGGVTFGF